MTADKSKKMASLPRIIRPYKESRGIFIFDENLDITTSTYKSEHLNEIAKAENQHFWFLNRRDKICKIFTKHVDKSARILEIGSGTGFVAAHLQTLGYNVDVSDVATNGLAFAKNRGLKQLYQFDLFNPPFEETYDVICLFDVIEHLHEDKLGLEMVKKMLKPAGKIILTVPAHSWLWNTDDILAGHKRRYTKNQLDDLFKQCTLEPTYIKYFFIFILPFLLLRRMIKSDSKGKIESKANFNIPALANILFHKLTKLEFRLSALLPNIMGGSIIGIAKKL